MPNINMSVSFKHYLNASINQISPQIIHMNMK